MKNLFIILFSGFIAAGSEVSAQGAAIKKRITIEKSIQLSTGVKLNYVEQGDVKGIPVILLHGFTDSWHSFEMVLPHLPSSFHVFAISQRGHGNSSKTSKHYHPENFAKDIAEFIQQKKLGPAIIVGHSMGSTNAQSFAVNYPLLTRALVLVSSFSNYDRQLIVEFKKMIDELKDPVDPVFIAEFQKSTVIKPIAGEMLDKFISESRKVPAHVWKGVAAGWSSTGYSRALQAFDKPTLIVWGDKDVYCPREDQDALANSIKNSKLLVYECIGHSLHWEEPERFANDLISFIKSVSDVRAAIKIPARLIEQSVLLSTGVKLEFIGQGSSDDIPLILLHGIGDSWHSFDKVLEYLPSSIHAFALTQRGHGNSSKPNAGYHPKDFASDIAAFMKEKKIEKAVLAGHSMGGVHALQFVLDYPELVAGIVTIDSDPAFNNNPGMPEFYQGLQIMNGSFDRDFMTEFQKSTLAKPIDSVYFDLLVEEALKVPVPVFRQAFKGLLDVDFSSSLKNISVPVLAFWGEKDTFCNRSDQEEFLKNCSNAKLIVYENTGHALHWEEPERFAKDLTEFVKSIH